MTSSLMIGLIFLLNPAAPEASPQNVFGHWNTHDGASIVEISDCGDGTPCGVVIWSEQDQAASARAPEADERPDERIAGITLLSGFRQSENGWTDGKIYNPDNGRTYRAKLARRADGHLMVKGCIRIGCKGFVWTPATDSPSETRLSANQP